MLPTIERRPRRSTYSSAVRHAAPFALSPAPARPRPRPRRRRPPPPELFEPSAPAGSGSPSASRMATLVSPRSTATSTCFLTDVVHLLCSSQLACLGELRRARMRVDRQEQANREEGSEYRRAPVAHERKGDAGYGHEPDGHADVDEDLEHEHGGHAGCDERAVETLGRGHDPERPPQE